MEEVKRVEWYGCTQEELLERFEEEQFELKFFHSYENRQFARSAYRSALWNAAEKLRWVESFHDYLRPYVSDWMNHGKLPDEEFMVEGLTWNCLWRLLTHWSGSEPQERDVFDVANLLLRNPELGRLKLVCTKHMQVEGGRPGEFHALVAERERAWKNQVFFERLATNPSL